MTAPKHISEEFIKHYFTSEATTARPTSWEVAIHTGSPGAGDQNEVSDYQYARQPVQFTVSDKGTYWEAENDADVAFPAASDDAPYEVTHYTIRDGDSGEAIATGALPVPVPVIEGTIITFPAGRIQVRGI